MIAFIDTSVLLRKLFGEADALADWPRIEEAFASRVLPLELGRVIDRNRLAGAIDDEQVERLHREARRVLKSVRTVPLARERLTLVTSDPRFEPYGISVLRA